MEAISYVPLVGLLHDEDCQACLSGRHIQGPKRCLSELPITNMGRVPNGRFDAEAEWAGDFAVP